MMKKTALLLSALTIGLLSAQAQTTNVITTAYGPATIGAGTTSLISNGATITGDITNSGQLLFNRSASAITNSYAVSGSGSVTVASASAVTLTASNSFSGPLTANNISGANYSAAPTLILSNSLGNAIQGNLVIGNATSGTVTVGAYAANQFGSNSVAVFNSLTSGSGNASYLTLHSSQTVAGLSGNMGLGGAIEVNQYGDSVNYGSQTLTVNVAAGTNYTLNGGSGVSGNIRNVDNTGSSVLTLLKSGAGTQTLTNVNINQTGGTIVNAGSLVVQGGAQNSANITVNGGTMQLSGAAAIQNYSGTNVTIASGATFQLDGIDADRGNGASSSGNAEFGSSSSSGSPLVISGAGTWLITGASSNSVVELGNNAGNSVKINMAQGGLINVASGALRSGGYSSPDWTSNKASLNVASGAVFELWDGNRPVTVDALTGAGVIGNALGNNNVTLSVGVANGSGTFSGGIADNIKGATGNTTSLTKLGTGTQILSGTNTYSGVTTVSAGVLEFVAPSSLYSNNVNGTFWNANYMTVGNGGTLAFGVGGSGQFSTSNITTLLTNGLLSNGGKGFLSGSSIGFDVAGGNFTLTNNLTNGVNGSLGLLAYGGNTLTLTGSNNYAGATRIDSGTTLQVGIGGTNGFLGSGTVSGSGTLAMKRSDSLTLSNTITGATAFSQIGGGTIVLTGTRSYTGQTTVSAGTLKLGSLGEQNLYIDNGSANSTNLLINGGTLINRESRIGDTAGTTGSATIESGAWTSINKLRVGYGGTGSLNITGGTITSFSTDIALNNNSVGNVTMSGGTWDSGLQFIVGGWSNAVGTVSISGGTLSNTYGYLGYNSGSTGIVSVSGGTWINSGSLSIGSGNGTLTVSGSGTVSVGGGSGTVHLGSVSNGTLNLGNGGSSAGTLLAGSVYGGNGSTVNVNSTGTASLGQNFTGTLNFNQIGTGTTVLTGSNYYTGITTISAGTLQVGNGGTNGKLGSGTVVNNGALAFNRSNGITLSNAISGSGSLVQNGTGTLTLSGRAKTYSGGTVINSGTLETAGHEILADSGSVTVNSGATFKVGQSETITSLNGAGTVSIAGFRYLRLSSGDFSGALSGGGDLYKTGADTFTLSGTSALTGALYLQNGTLVADSTTALNANNYVLMSAGSTFTANQNLVLGGIDQNGGTIDGSGVITAVSTITSSGAINSVLGDVVGYNSGLLKLGTGTTTLGAANTYTGTTKVHEGTLKLGANGSLAANSSAHVGYEGTLDLGSHNQTFADVWANTTVAGSGTMTVTGTLNGSGTITPDTVITGTHSPGNSPGIQTFGGNLTYQPGATMLWQLADNTTTNSPVAYDQVLVGGNLTFNAGTTLQLAFNDVGSLVNWTDALWTTDQSWTIYQVSGLTSGLENLSLADYTLLLDVYGNEFGTALAGASFSISQNGQDVTLTYTVPEPSTYVLFGLGALALVIAYRRKRA